MFARALCKAVKPAVFNARRTVAVRQFSDVLGIPTDKEQQWGRRKEELDAAAAGEIAFDHEASIVPAADRGTKENPIMVCSRLSCVHHHAAIFLLSANSFSELVMRM